MANIILEKYFTSRIGKMYPTIFRQKFFCTGMYNDKV